ncbi:bifunctional folylpolyglutamate synthase/dihydrofolate synthase [Mycetocola manganoxydans]|uniref:tetrahydrofolate synthase n=1 Tax=Mycetocola manganoxydans TaxID=699879 RepID=A0A3L6ZVG9_9MICO|nr:folylpolyglutamate synthase/dihydrofolate synthase family protein [Mycetocola manganoxydans]RLP71685.1 bifunctional folylpolyglutamate synthase/dihydrofolate synthase [Mycetocola manganoxydans]GHD39039.1 dihydrofolate synthase [Mycetocola manganoxydans]
MSDRDEINDEFAEQGRAVYEALLARTGEGAPQPRLEPTRRALDLLGDPQRAYPIIQLAGTNGKTSTSRMIEGILRGYGLRTGLFTSPHLVSFNERIVVDGEPISNETLVRNWEDIQPYLNMVDLELEEAGEPTLTFFEVLTVLGFAVFADAPVDVAVVEVGMGGEWDSTNVADAAIAVFTPIDLDHTNRLGSTIAEIARTKSGIIKPAATVVTAAQHPDAMAQLKNAAELSEAPIVVQDVDFALTSDVVAVGGQVISVRGRAGEYTDLYLPLYGDHQGQNAALAVATVETFLGNGLQRLSTDPLTEGLTEVESPGRLQLVGIEPTVLVDAAHNPHGARSLEAALGKYFDFREIVFVLGVLGDKDAEGILEVLAPLAARIHLTASTSTRSVPVDELTDRARARIDPRLLHSFDSLEDAVFEAREWANEGESRLVVVTGSVVLAGEVVVMAEDNGWKK